ncbi:MAG: hypothetical protein NTV30_09310 [Chloroflexi bacterium]|nr:hypothetical protein [Chloroflexota bacterium]
MLSDRCFDVIDAPTYTKALIWFLIGNQRKKLILLLLDFLGISFTFFLSYFLSNYFFSVSIQRELYISVFLSSVFFMVIGLYLLNAYKPIENRRAETELAIITKSITFAFLLTFAVHFIFFKNIALSRYIMILWWFGSIFTLIFFRFSIRELYKTLWRKGYLREKVLLVGSNDNVDIIREQIVIQRHDRFNFFSTWTEGYNDEFSKRLKELNID